MIEKKEYMSRRQELMSMMHKNSIAVISSAPEKVRSRDTNYPYKQNVNLTYLAGFPEPESVLVLIPDREDGQVILFCRDKDPLRETWDGYREGPASAIKKYGFDDAFPISDIDDILPNLIEGKDRLYYAVGKDADFDRFAKFHGPSVDAHKRAMKFCKPGIYEYQLQAEIEHEFQMSGANGPAYTSIVGGGANGCILHYIENKDMLKNGDLVLIDAGCEYEDYASDITRTFPVNGKFSDEQAAIYDIVLKALKEAIDVTQAGTPYNKTNETTIRVITEGLVELGLLKGDINDLIKAEAHREFYMHGAGHWLGLDVHDVGDYKIDGEWRIYEPGMVVTIEPGIYISPKNKKVDTKWRGIGVRIEDDIVITKTGNINLTSKVPKERNEIEKMMAK